MPFNIASYSLLTHMIAHVCDLKVMFQCLSVCLSVHMLLCVSVCVYVRACVCTYVCDIFFPVVQSVNNLP